MKIENLCVKYDKNIVIENFSLNLTLGEKIIIYGPNGTGKSNVGGRSRGLRAAGICPDAQPYTFSDGLRYLLFYSKVNLTRRQIVERGVGFGNQRSESLLSKGY